MTKSKVLDRGDNLPEINIFMSLYGKLQVRINGILKDKGITLDKLTKDTPADSEIVKYLMGEFVYDLKSLAKLQHELGEKLIEIVYK